jgi:hypothetical protein
VSRPASFSYILRVRFYDLPLELTQEEGSSGKLFKDFQNMLARLFGYQPRVQPPETFLGGTGRTVICLDHSSSMSWVPGVVHSINQMLSTLSSTPGNEGCVASVLSFNAELTWNQENVPASKLKTIDAHRWHANPGGLLKGGSRLGDALYESAKLLCSKPKGAASLVMLADGWPRYDEISYEEVRRQLERARAHGVKLMFFAFLSDASVHQLKPFVTAVGLRNDEVYIFSSSSAEQQANDARQSTVMATSFIVNTSIIVG